MIIAVIIRGRHRGLPVAIDRAVILKGHDFPDSREQNDQPSGIADDRDGRLSRSIPQDVEVSATETPSSSISSAALAAHLLDSPGKDVANAERQSANGP